MTLSELKRAVDEAIERAEIDDLDPDDIEVKLAMQPNWPFEYSVCEAQLITADDLDESEEDGDEDDDDDAIEPAFWLGEGNQEGYLPSAVKELVWG